MSGAPPRKREALMRIRTGLMIGALILVASASSLEAQDQVATRGGRSCQRALVDRFDLLVSEELRDAEVADILFLKEEEKLARDVYLTLSLDYDLPVFVNIARAEQRHMRLVDLLIERYQLADPVVDDTIGRFSDADLAALYADLVARGRKSLLEALWVGATIEDLDLADLYSLLDDTDNLDVALIAHNLAAGSRNHLREFVRNLEARDATCEGQYLDPETVEDVLASPTEAGVVCDEFGQVLAECGGVGLRGTDRRGGVAAESGTRRCNGACDGAGPHGGGPASGQGICDGAGSGGNVA